ncbi:MAG: hypothetical protein ACJA1A_002678 [Saprospiraceae bacterium]|jgi:uncharacterized protein YxjI
MEFAVYTISISGVFKKTYEIFQGENSMYSVESESFWSSKEMVFRDHNDNAVLLLNRVSSFLKTEFVISDLEKDIATVTKEGFGISFYSESIYGNHLLKGKSFNTDFTVYDGDNEIAKVSRKTFRSKDKYGVAIKKGQDEKYILALTIAIEVVIQMQQNG